MNKIILFFMFVAFSGNAQTQCENGFAGEYPCDNMELLSFMDNSIFEANRGNDCWGWTDSLTGKEYAIYGNSENAAFVDITNPISPLYIGKLNTHTTSSIWRDIKVYKNHAFIVSEAGGHGMQIFDLTRLRNVSNPPVVFTEDAYEGSFGHAHNIVINEESGYAYIVGANVYNGGPEFINIQDPLNPVVEGGFSAAGYSHDAQVVIYKGPDQDYQGKEIYFGANERNIVIIDVSDKSKPKIISQFSYPLVRYTHQLWIDENHETLFANDEADESSFGNNTRNIVFDIKDLDNPVFKTVYLGPSAAIDHNNYVYNDKLYIANYRAGVRVIDISNVEASDSLNNTMKEIGYFDTYPNDDNTRFDGAWSVYPYFKSGSIVISDINRGMFIVKMKGKVDATSDLSEENTIEVYPNPSNDFITFKTNGFDIEKISIYDLSGKLVNKIKIVPKQIQIINVTGYKPGFYLVKLNNSIFKNIVILD